MMNSGSESDQDFLRRRKRRQRLPSTSSDSSDDSLIIPRKRNGPKKVVISESSDSGSEVEVRKRKRRTDRPVIESEIESEGSSDGEGKSCPVCLGKLDHTALSGQPDNCEHVFCCECVIEWSKNNTSCPLCRQAFTKIKIYLKGELLEEVPVKTITPEQLEENLFISDIVCIVCNQSDSEHTLLLCDECDDAYHCACLTPPLWSVPPGQWFCPRCSRDNVDDDDDDDEPIPVNLSFYVPRTRATERVRRTVQSSRRNATRQSNQRRSTTRRSGPSSTRRRTTAKTTTRRRTAKPRAKRRRITRKSRGGRRRKIIRKAYTASIDSQRRIAQSLGLSNRVLDRLNRNNVGFHVLSLDEPSTSRVIPSVDIVTENRKAMKGLAPDLHIFGRKNDFEPNGGSDYEEPVREAPEEPKVAPVNFLDSLLEKQDVLLSKKSLLKRDDRGVVRLVSSDSIKTPQPQRRITERKSSTEIQSSSTNRSENNSEYDMRYKAPRVSRYDPSSTSSYNNTIEDVIRDHAADISSIRNETFDDAEAQVEYINGIGLSDGWINSLKMTVPVVNSLTVSYDHGIHDPVKGEVVDRKILGKMETEFGIKVEQDPSRYKSCAGGSSRRRRSTSRGRRSMSRERKPIPNRDRRRSSSRERFKDGIKDRRRSTSRERRGSRSRDRRRSTSKSRRNSKERKRSRERRRSSSRERRRDRSPHRSEKTRDRSPRRRRSPVRSEDRRRSRERRRSRDKRRSPDTKRDKNHKRGRNNSTERKDSTRTSKYENSSHVRIKQESGTHRDTRTEVSNSHASQTNSTETKDTEKVCEVQILQEVTESPKTKEAPTVIEIGEDFVLPEGENPGPIPPELQDLLVSGGVPIQIGAQINANKSIEENRQLLKNLQANIPVPETAHNEGYSSGVESVDLEERMEAFEMKAIELPQSSKKRAESPKEKKEDKKYFVDREKFQDVVVAEIRPVLKKFYRKHQISKEDYKEIFKKVIKKVCRRSNKPKQLVCTKSIRKLLYAYVAKARQQIKKDCIFEEEQEESKDVENL